MKILLYICHLFFPICLNHFPNIDLPAVILCITSAPNHAPTRRWASNKAHSSVSKLSSLHFEQQFGNKLRNSHERMMMMALTQPEIITGHLIWRKETFLNQTTKGTGSTMYMHFLATVHNFSLLNYFYVTCLQMNMFGALFFKTKNIFVREALKKQPSP